MAFVAHVLEVMISTPGDTAEEVDTVRNALHGWNASRAPGAQTILLPRFWKTDSIPQLSASGGQSVINSQLVDRADVVIALFDSRLGQETDSAVSGTAEEIERAADASKPVHVYFSDEPIDRGKFEATEFARLEKFRNEMQSKGLLGVYTDLNDLAFKVRNAIEDDLTGMALGVPNLARNVEHAIPVLKLIRGINDALRVTNLSQSIVAEGFTVDFGELGGSVLNMDDSPFNLNPQTEMSWILALDMQSPTRADIRMSWEEGGVAQELIQTISLFGA